MQSYTLQLVTTWLIAIDLMTRGIYGMAARMVAHGVVERVDVI